MSTWYANHRDPSWVCAPLRPDATAFHRTLDGYAPTPLVDAHDLADELGVGRVLVKDESSRLGLPAFKALGASWAVRQVIDRRAATDAGGTGIPDRSQNRGTLVTATDGNHGRAIAHYARLLGQDARVFVPRGVSEHAVAAIEGEGAPVTRIDGDYDAAVAAAAHAAAANGWDLVQDTAWEGYTEVPSWIVEGYRTLLVELDEQAAALGTRVDLVIVPTGVGSLLQTVLAHYRAGEDGPAIVAVEPDVAACMAPSLAAGEPVTVPTGVTTMAGLNCGTPSQLAWPFIRGGVDAVVTVSDEQAADAGTTLAEQGVAAGPCGSASLAAARTIVADATLDGATRDDRLRHLGLRPDSTIALLVTDGVSSA